MRLFPHRLRRGLEFVPHRTGTSGGVGRLFWISSSVTVLGGCLMFTFLLLLFLFSSPGLWVLSFPFCIIMSWSSKSENGNLVQSLAIDLPHKLRRNLQFTVVIKSLSIDSLQRTPLYQHLTVLSVGTTSAFTSTRVNRIPTVVRLQKPHVDAVAWLEGSLNVVELPPLFAQMLRSNISRDR